MENIIVEENNYVFGIDYGIHPTRNDTEFAVAMGWSASATSFGVAIGSHSNAKYRNSVAIGKDVTTTCDDGINIANKILFDADTNEVTISGHTFIDQTLHVTKKLVIDKTVTLDETVNCDACLELDKWGLSWGDVVSGANCGICLNCIRDTVMFFKAKERWEQHMSEAPTINNCAQEEPTINNCPQEEPQSKIDCAQKVPTINNCTELQQLKDKVVELESHIDMLRSYVVQRIV